MTDLLSPGKFVGSTIGRLTYFHPSLSQPNTFQPRSPAGVKSAAPYTTYLPPRAKRDHPPLKKSPITASMTTSHVPSVDPAAVAAAST